MPDVRIRPTRRRRVSKRGPGSRPHPRSRTTRPRLVLPGLGRREVGRDRIVGGRQLVVDEITIDGGHRDDADSGPRGVDDHPALRLVRRETRTHGRHPGLVQRGERRRDPRVLPVEGMVVPQRDEVDTELVEHVGDGGWRLEEEALARIRLLVGEFTDDGLEVDDRRIGDRRDGDGGHRRHVVPTPNRARQGYRDGSAPRNGGRASRRHRSARRCAPRRRARSGRGDGP